jgi:hypothetical protein
MSKGGIPVSEWSGSGATDRLRQVIEQFSTEATKQTRHLIVLTRWLVVLTIILAVGLVVQIVLALTT